MSWCRGLQYFHFTFCAQSCYLPINSAPLLQSSLNSLPVNHIPNSIEILRLAVLILQIIRMLPSINTQQRCEFANDGILVGICADEDLTGLVVLDKPCPATALDTCQCGVEFGLEGGEVAVAGFDCSLRMQFISHAPNRPTEHSIVG